MTEENFSLYELMLIINPNIGEEASLKEIEKIKKFISDLEGKVTHEDVWGLRNLAYKIKKEDKGFYVVLNFKMDPSKIIEFKSEMMLEQVVLRHMLMLAPKYYEMKTLVELEKEAETYKKESKEKEEEKEKEVQVHQKPKPVAKAKVEEDKKPEIKEPEVEEIEEPEVKEPEVEEVVKEKPADRISTKKDLEEVDAKLKSIIDDPDITL